MIDFSKISPYAILIVVIGRFSEPFKSEKNNKWYSTFLFEGGKFLLEMPQDVAPGTRIRAVFESDPEILMDSRNRSKTSFTPAKALAFEPLK